MSQILIFGDSITWGAWDTEGGWVQRLRKEIDKGNMKWKYYIAVQNLGISGGTSNTILNRFENEAKARLEEGKTIIIFSFGGNDSGWLLSKKSNQVSQEEFRNNIENLIKKAKKITNKVIFTGLCKHDETKTNPVSWHKDFCYKNKFLAAYNEIIKETCQKESVDFIEVMDIFENDYVKLLEDGVHPNNKGHELIFKRVYYYLIKNKFIPKP